LKELMMCGFVRTVLIERPANTHCVWNNQKVTQT